jgi:hypothetical protein
MWRFGTDRSGIAILASAEKQKESLLRIESRTFVCKPFRRATTPTTSVEICLGERRRSFQGKALSKPKIARKMLTVRRVCIHHFHSASETSSQDATFFSNLQPTANCF